MVLALAAALLTGLTGSASAAPLGTVGDSGFEQQNSRAISALWTGEGPDYKGIDIDLGYHKTGRKNAFIRTSSRNWNAITQKVTVKPQTVYYLEGWVRTSGNYTTGYFGARGTNGRTIVQKNYGKVISNGAHQFLHMAFNSGTNIGQSRRGRARPARGPNGIRYGFSRVDVASSYAARVP
ncbi:hypothetical protein ACIA98_41530 [Streptomyces sp. NPDC051366]|uniref:hypothetical protein n=1 Tax=Streptomyces sp. NPDC051366 TaxID=3365652 RepID=UPI0037ADA85A